MQTRVTQAPGKCCNLWTSGHLIAFKSSFFFFLLILFFQPLLITSLISKSSHCFLENLEKHSFLETILLMCSLPYIAFFLYYYANAFGREYVYFWRIALLISLICVWSHSHLALVNKQQVWNMQESRLWIKFTFSLNICEGAFRVLTVCSSTLSEAWILFSLSFYKKRPV